MPCSWIDDLAMSDYLYALHREYKGVLKDKTGDLTLFFEKAHARFFYTFRSNIPSNDELNDFIRDNAIDDPKDRDEALNQLMDIKERIWEQVRVVNVYILIDTDVGLRIAY